MPYRRWKNFLIYLTISVLTLLLGCAPLIPPPPDKPFSQKKTAHLISHLREEGEKIVSFQGIGRLRFKEGEEETEANLFAVGCKPFKVRLEITHPWGKPLFHIVVDERNISALSLIDKKFFTGLSSLMNADKFFMFELDLDLGWKILTGRVPILSTTGEVVSLKPNEITLFNRQGEVVEIIYFVSQPPLPRYIYFPKKGFTIVFSEFREGRLGPYPSRIKIIKGDENQLEIRYTNLRVNRPIPKEIFQLNPPPDFEIINLNHKRR
jgi:hypothetical protein